MSGQAAKASQDGKAGVAKEIETSGTQGSQGRQEAKLWNLFEYQWEQWMQLHMKITPKLLFVVKCLWIERKRLASNLIMIALIARVVLTNFHQLDEVFKLIGNGTDFSTFTNLFSELSIM